MGCSFIFFSKRFVSRQNKTNLVCSFAGRFEEFETIGQDVFTVIVKKKTVREQALSSEAGRYSGSVSDERIPKYKGKAWPFINVPVGRKEMEAGEETTSVYAVIGCRISFID